MESSNYARQRNRGVTAPKGTGGQQPPNTAGGNTTRGETARGGTPPANSNIACRIRIETRGLPDLELICYLLDMCMCDFQLLLSVVFEVER